MEINDVKIDFLGHSGFLITSKEGKRIFIDPYNLSENVSKEKADYILITHSHYDHCSIKDIQKIIGEKTKIIIPADVQSKITRLESAEMQVMEVGEQVEFGNIRIEALPAYNIGKEFHTKKDHWLGYLIKINELVIYHAGDTDKIQEMEKLTGYGKHENKFVAFLPVSGKYVMDADEAAEVAKMLNTDIAIPMHYGSGVIGTIEDANKFVSACQQLGIKAMILEKISMTELVKPEFVFGTEKRFFDFIGSLGNEKVALISHGSDLDGIASAKIISEVLKPNLIKLVGYDDLNDKLIEELKKDKIKKIVISDLFVKNLDFINGLEKFAEILIIDHHLVESDWNSDKTIYLDCQKFCAAYLSYYLFSKMQDISDLDWLAAYASITDVAYKENFDWLKRVLDKYGEKYDLDELSKGKYKGNLKILMNSIVYFRNKEATKVINSIGKKYGDLKDLSKYSEMVDSELKKILESFKTKKEEMNGRIFFEYKSDLDLPLSSLISTELSFKEPDKTFIIATIQKGAYRISARRQDRKENMNDLLINLTKGFKDFDAGGHVPAAGGYIALKDIPEFKKRLRDLK